MLRLDGEPLLLGGFHDHWSRWDARNPALLLAALDYYHYDFVTLMCGPEVDAPHLAVSERLGGRVRLYPGREEFFGWGHLVVVNPRAPRLEEGDNPDYEAVMRRLGGTSDLVVLAHPDYPGTWDRLFLTGEVDRLLDAGAIDGVNLINTAGFDGGRHREQIAWFGRREAAGKKTPIVGGWDAHLVLPVPGRPPVLYGPGRSPRGHIDTAGNNRTILFCGENALPAIVEAVRAGRTVIEDLRTGELVGPAPLVRFLKEHGYAAEIARLDAGRDALRLAIPAPWIAGEVCFLPRPEGGEGKIEVAVPTEAGLRDAVVSPPGPEGKAAVAWPAAPSGRDRDYALVTLRLPGTAREERHWAVETQHPVQIEVLPRYRGAAPGIEIAPQRPFAGTFSVEIDGLFSWSGRIEGPLWLELPASASETLRAARWKAVSDAGMERSEKIVLTFLEATRFTGSWDRVPIYAVDRAQFAPAYSYGAARPYPGPDVYAAYYQFAWNEEAFFWRARVRDAVHFQPETQGHYLYNADCLQLAVDPLLRRSESIGHVYSFNLALTPRGPLVHRWLSPDQEADGTFRPLPADTSLAAGALRVEPWEGGLVYELRLPWAELAPARPRPGARMGLYGIAFNNDGTGLTDTLHWPVPISGMWQSPRRWGVLSLLP